MYVDVAGLKATGTWLDYAHIDRGSISASYLGWEPTFGLDKYLTLLMVRLNFNVSGNIVASVRCEDDCSHKTWDMSFNGNVSIDDHIDVGLNIPATIGSIATRKPSIGAIINAIVIDLKLNGGLQELGSGLETKAAIINAFGPDLICEQG